MKGKFTLFEFLITDKDKSNIFKVGDVRNKPKKLIIRYINSTSFSFDFIEDVHEEEYYIDDVPFRLLKEEVINAVYFKDVIEVFINKE